jgi:hypothetical protein
MKKLLVLISCLLLVPVALAESMQSGKVEVVELEGDHGGKITISGKRYGYNNNAVVKADDTVLSADHVTADMDVRYSLHYPLGTGAFIKTLQITGPQDLVDELTNQ